MIDRIRMYAPQSIVIVGTPTWSQDVDIASSSPIERTNLLYSLHFYAATHKEDLQSKMQTALTMGFLSLYQNLALLRLPETESLIPQALIPG